ncbi:thiamine phosphate synthase [Dokdonella sp.]|uniref:thiamine phosphate synthase n=1 Tax=Dokdonella sp. TaxID=2291710 RepID=UPI003C6F7B13
MIRLHGLYAITAGPRPDLEAAVDAALAGGARIIQYRDKTRDRARRSKEAAILARACARFTVPLIINDDVELALECAAAGVHLGSDDEHIDVALERLGQDAIVGVSCYDSLQRAREMAAQGASYVAFGAFFPSYTKPGARKAGLDLLRYSADLGIPRVAIGGVTPDNAQALIDAGADCVAVVNALFGAANIEASARQFSNLFPLTATRIP